MKNNSKIGSLVNYIANNYSRTAEIGIGNFPDIAYSLLERGVQVFAIDIKPLKYKGLRVIVDDIMNPEIMLYKNVELIYSYRTPAELMPYILQLARKIPSDVIVKPLSSDEIDGRLISYKNTTFLLWSYYEKKYNKKKKTR